MTLNAHRIEPPEPARTTRCAACTPPEDREPMMIITLESLAGKTSFALCDHHREGLEMTCKIFGRAFMDSVGNEEDEP